MIAKISKIIQSLSKTERQILIGALFIFFTSFIFWELIDFYKNTELKPAEGGTYTEGLMDQPIAVNPLISVNEADRDIAELVLADLLELAESYQLSDDQKTWNINLKSDLKWSDGEPLTADDVIFTLETIQDPETRSPLYQTWQGVMAERISEKQMRFLLKNPHAFFLDNLKTFKVAPRHIFENIPSANIPLSQYNLEPVGSGPYRFVKYKKRKDGFITDYYLERNPYYAQNRPWIEKFNFKFFSDKQGLLDAFNKKEIDGLSGLSYNDLQELKISHRVFKINILSYYSVFFNPAINQTLKDKEVRRAMTLATDKKRIADAVFGGQAMIVSGPILPMIAGYDYSIYKDEEFSQEKAVEILEKNNWKINEDGVRSKSIGGKKIKLEFEIVVPQVEFLIKTAEIIKENWQKIGIKLNPLILQPSEITKDIIKTRNYQMILFGAILKNNPDIFSFWHSSERFYPGGNLAIFSNKTADELLESVKTALDEKTRQEYLTKIQTLIYDEKPAIFLFSPSYFYVAPQNLGGFNEKVLVSRANRFDNADQWYLKTKRRSR
jgi:peptide/nickel transport system substrate-binding protein